MASAAEVNLPAPATWVPGRQKNSMILVDPEGFNMRYKTVEGTKKYYVCSKKDKIYNCPVSATVDTELDSIVAMSGSHNHDNGLLKIEIQKKVDSQVEQAKQNPSTSPRSVMEEITSKVLNDNNTKFGLAYLPRPKTLAKSIQRKRKLEMNCPALPRSMADVEVPDSMKKTSDGKQFLLLDTNIDGKEDKLIIGFASPTMLQVLRVAREWFIDGTWDIVSQTFFTQAWVVVAKLDSGVSVASAFFLLPDKNTSSYKLALKCLKDNDVDGPELIHVDFEQAEIKSIKEVFPDSKLVTCEVHWKRALRTKMQKLGLLPYYNRNCQVQVFFRKIWALSYVPKEDTIVVWEHLLEMAPEMDPEQMEEELANFFNQAIESFFTYFEFTWIGSVNKRTKKRGRPLYPIDVWNKREEVLAEEELTTNSSESWNSVSKMSLPMKPNLWAVMESFKKEDGLARSKVMASATGNTSDQNPGRTKKIADKRSKLSNAVGRYSTMLLDDWLDMMGVFYD